MFPTFLVVLGVITIFAGLLNLNAKDFIWETQVYNRARYGQEQIERTSDWDSSRSVIGTIALVVGVVFSILGIIYGVRSQPPIGVYTCLPSDPGINNVTTKILKLEYGGHGSFDKQPLTWTHDTRQNTVTFQGDISLVSGNFPLKNDLNNFTVTDARGESRLCLNYP